LLYPAITIALILSIEVSIFQESLNVTK
jgi:hypothetical protein